MGNSPTPQQAVGAREKVQDKSEETTNTTNVVEEDGPPVPDVKAIGEKGRTTVHMAVMTYKNDKSKFQRHVSALVKYGADVNARDDDDRTAAHLVVINVDSPDMLQTLEDNGANLGAPCAEGTILHLAIVYQKRRIVNYILEKHQELVNIPQEKIEMYPLHYAIVCKDRDAFHGLLKAGADFDKKSKTFYTPLAYMCTRAGKDVPVDMRKEFLETLISLGADFASVDFTTKNPLMHAISDRNFELVEVLLKQKRIPLDVLSGGWEKQTALMFAAQVGMPERFLKMLLDEGAFPNIISPSSKKTASQIARDAKNLRAAELIESYMTTDGISSGRPAIVPPPPNPVASQEFKTSASAPPEDIFAVDKSSQPSFQSAKANLPSLTSTPSTAAMATEIKNLRDEVKELKKLRADDLTRIEELERKFSKLMESPRV
jgi:ankyrin repeat protein